jgi:leader peptidase (prepilin peptidase)/N-methyltransferase
MGILLSVFLGLIAGFLVNYLSDVLPTLRKLGRPVCIKCGTAFQWKDYLAINTCSSCGLVRSWRTYITLGAGVLFSLALWLSPPVRMGYWLSLLVLIFFGLVVVIDIEHRLILHMVSIAGALLGIVIGTVRYNLVTALLGGLVGLAIMLIFYGFGILFSRYRARKFGHDDGEEALGFGDVTLSMVLGLMLGWPLILYGLMFGILIGGLVSLVLVLFLIVSRRYETMTVFTSYGPYLVLGASILLFFPNLLTVLQGI